MRRYVILMLAGSFAAVASLAVAACPPGAKCVEAPAPPSKPGAKPAPPRSSARPMVVQGPQGGQPFGPSVRRSAPARRSPAGPRPEGITGPPDALIIHRSDNGYTRHYVGEGGPPKRDEHGAAYLYHGRSYAPFRVGRYHWPKGETYHRYHRHERLPRIFLIPEYFIDNYDDYEVAAPPANAQWVRYGDDLVLVDVDTGDILNVVSGVFTDTGDGSDDGTGDEGMAAPDSGPEDIRPPPN